MEMFCVQKIKNVLKFSALAFGLRWEEIMFKNGHVKNFKHFQKNLTNLFFNWIVTNPSSAQNPRSVSELCQGVALTLAHSLSKRCRILTVIMEDFASDLRQLQLGLGLELSLKDTTDIDDSQLVVHSGAATVANQFRRAAPSNFAAEAVNLQVGFMMMIFWWANNYILCIQVLGRYPYAITRHAMHGHYRYGRSAGSSGAGAARLGAV